MKMTCKILLMTMAILSSPCYLSAQLVATGTNTPPVTPVTLVQQDLLGTGVMISNVNTNVAAGANPRQFARFTNNTTNSNLPFTSGVMLCTGFADDFNNVGNTQGGFTSMDTSICTGGGICGPSDVDLDVIVNPYTTGDAAVLEFDFVPLFDTIYFRYIFASEEYPEFVCDMYNDVFAFLLSGPGIVGTKNVARIPNTNVPVAINSVNSGLPGGFNTSFPNCVAPNGSLAYSAYYVNNTTSTTLQFDGLTTVMDVIEPVQAGATYHIKLAIADVGDGSYDSAVFLEASSLKSAGTTTPITKVEKTLAFEVFQNPSNDFIQIKQFDNKELTMVLFDNIGRVVLTQTSYGVITEINLQNLPRGLYYLNLNSGETSETHKVLR